jgi:hypothetical protein
MFTSLYDELDEDSPIIFIIDQIISLELFWPLPLVVVGILGILNYMIVGIALCLALLPWVARFMAFGHFTRPAFLSLPMLLLTGSGFFGVWASYQPELSWPLMLTLLGSVSLFFAIANATLPPRWLVSGVVTIATFLAVYFITQYGHFDYRDEYGRIHELGLLTGSFLPNLAFFVPYINGVAAFLSGAFLLGLVLTWQSYQQGKNEKALLWGVIVFIMGYAMLITSSRGAWLGLIIAGMLWIFLSVPNGIRYLGKAIVGLAGASIALLVIVNLVSPNWLISLQETAVSRLTLYRNSLYLLGDYPFTGIGLGDTFTMAYSRYQLLMDVAFLKYSHNIFLSIGLGQGIIGIITFVWLLIVFYHVVIRVEQVGLSQRPQQLFRGAWLGVTATLLHGLTDAPQFSDSRWTLPMFFVLMGLAVSIGRPALLWADEEAGSNESDEATESAATWPKFAFVGGGAVILVILALLFQTSLRGTWHANMGAVYQTQADLTKNLDESIRDSLRANAISEFEQAINIQPDQVVAHRRLGMMALNNQDFDTAITHLEVAYPQEPTNQATVQALGLSYLWTGQLDKAEQTLRQLDRVEELAKDLPNRQKRWEKDGYSDIAAYTGEMAERLKDVKGN